MTVCVCVCVCVNGWVGGWVWWGRGGGSRLHCVCVGGGVGGEGGGWSRLSVVPDPCFV